MDKQNFIQKMVGGLKERFGPVHYTRASSTPSTPPANTLDTARFLAAIAANETSIVKGDKYKFAKPSGNPALGRDLGKYQVTEGELKTYGKRYLGEPISGNNFLASSTAQDRYVATKAKMLSEKGYTPQQIADIHRRGYTKSSAPGTAIYQDPMYVEKFNANYNATTTPIVAR